MPILPFYGYGRLACNSRSPSEHSGLELVRSRSQTRSSVTHEGQPHTQEQPLDHELEGAFTQQARAGSQMETKVWPDGRSGRLTGFKANLSVTRARWKIICSIGVMNACKMIGFGPPLHASVLSDNACVLCGRDRAVRLAAHEGWGILVCCGSMPKCQRRPFVKTPAALLRVFYDPPLARLPVPLAWGLWSHSK